MHSGRRGGVCERNTIWRCVGLKWQPEAVVWVMENEVVATAQAKREKQLWTAGLRIHMQLPKKECVCKKRHDRGNYSELISS